MTVMQEFGIDVLKFNKVFHVSFHGKFSVKKLFRSVILFEILKMSISTDDGCNANEHSKCFLMQSLSF